jgi:DNA-binding transcriptional regulator GbsR (MarR family)
MESLDKYLDYLHEQEGAGKFVSGEVQGAVGQWALWSLLAVPATALAWKLANAMFSKADRKCGGPIASRTPGFKICVARERMRALQKQLSVAQKALSECRMTKNPISCNQKWKLEIEKTKNKIKSQQENIKNLLGEQANIQELELPTPQAVAGFGIAIITMDVLDKSIFLIRRLIQASYNKSVRRCGLFQTDTARNLCMAKFKLLHQKKEISQLTGVMIKCNKTKSPNECREKISKKIDKLKRDIQITQDNITSYTNQLNTEKGEAALKKAMKTTATQERE